MIIVGWGKNLKVLGETYLLPCPNCNNENVWQIVEGSKKVSLYFVPIAKWDKHYFFMCPVCNWGIELANREEAQDILLQTLEGKTDLLENILHRFELEGAGDVEGKHSVEPHSNPSSIQSVVCDSCGCESVADQITTIQSGHRLCPTCIKELRGS